MSGTYPPEWCEDLNNEIAGPESPDREEGGRPSASPALAPRPATGPASGERVSGRGDGPLPLAAHVRQEDTAHGSKR